MMMLSFAPTVVTATTATAVLTYCFMVALPRPSRHSFLFSLFVSRPPLALDVQNIAWACGGYYPPRPMRECRRPRRLARTHCAIRSTAMGMHLWLERRVPGRTPYLTARNAGTMTSHTGAGKARTLFTAWPLPNRACRWLRTRRLSADLFLKSLQPLLLCTDDSPLPWALRRAASIRGREQHTNNPLRWSEASVQGEDTAITRTVASRVPRWSHGRSRNEGVRATAISGRCGRQATATRNSKLTRSSPKLPRRVKIQANVVRLLTTSVRRRTDTDTGVRRACTRCFPILAQYRRWARARIGNGTWALL